MRAESTLACNAFCMADKNTILVVDDDPKLFGFYWQIFNDDPHEFDLLPRSEDASRHHPLVPHSLGDFSKFEEMFRQMVDRGEHHPLCIVDMRFEKANDNRRGFETARLVRELDPEINIVIATHLPDVELEDVRLALGDNAFLFRLPMLEEAQKAEFRNTVHLLVDRWNAKQKLLQSLERSAPESVPLSEVLNAICADLRRENASIEAYINPGLGVRSHREHLANGLGCVLRQAVEASPPSGCIRVFGESAASGAVVSVSDERQGVAPRSADELAQGNSKAAGLGFFLFETFLSSNGGSLKVETSGLSGGTTVTADIRNL